MMTDPQEELKKVEAAIELKKVEAAMAAKNQPKSTQEPQRAARPFGSQFDVLNPKTKFDAPQDVADARDLGLTLRAGVEGLASIPAIVIDPVIALAKAGIKATTGRESEQMSLNEIVSYALDSTGVPSPEGRKENLVQMGAQGMTGGGAFLKGAQALSRASSPVKAAIGKTMSSQPTAVVVSGGTGSASSELAQQAGAGPVGQLAAGVLGGALVPGGIKPKTLKPKTAFKTQDAESALNIKNLATKAQMADDPLQARKLQAEQATVISQPKVQARLAEQNRAIKTVVDDFVDGINTEGTGTVPKLAKARDGAKEVMDKLYFDRKQAAEPWYTKAKNNQTKPIETANLQKSLKAVMDEADLGTDLSGRKPSSNVQAVAGEFLSRVEAAQGSVRKLHKAKEWIDNELGKYGEGAWSKDAKRLMTEQKKVLTEILVEGSDDYAKGYAEHIRLSAPIDEMRDSIVGIFADADNVQLSGFLKSAFNKPIEEINALKGALDQIAPGTYSGLYQSHLKNLLGEISTVGDNPAMVKNLPSDYFQKLIGSGSYEKLIATAPDKAVRENLKYLKDVMSAYKTARPSPTLTDEMLKARADIKGVAGAIAHYANSIIWHPIGTTGVVGSKAMSKPGVEKRINNIVDMLLSPEYDDVMQVLKQTTKSEAQKARIVEQVLMQMETSEQQESE